MFSMSQSPIEGTLTTLAISNSTTIVDHACNPLLGDTLNLSEKEKLAVIRRGTCTFVQQLTNAGVKGPTPPSSSSECTRIGRTCSYPTNWRRERQCNQRSPIFSWIYGLLRVRLMKIRCKQGAALLNVERSFHRRSWSWMAQHISGLLDKYSLSEMRERDAFSTMSSLVQH